MFKPTEHILAACLSRYAQWYHAKLWLLIEEYGSLLEVWKDYKKSNSLPPLLVEKLTRAWTEENFVSMQKLFDSLMIIPLLSIDKHFPENLRALDDCPYIIYIQGKTELLNYKRMVSCVGTRNISVYGKRVIERLIGGLEGYDVAVVSGLALGVDAYAHKVALEANLPTLAVLAGGLDRYEPLTNAALGRRIAEVGCMVSEYPPGVRPQKHQFLERNRLIAGLSPATIVIEGKQHSGSLVTARQALKYGREVGSPPGDIFSPNSQGPHYLLRDGAWPLCSAEDVCAMLGIDFHVSEEVVEDPILLALTNSPMTIDAIHEMLNMPIPLIYEKLTVFEMSGRIETLATGEYYLKK